jgi:hypothetical protein
VSYATTDPTAAREAAIKRFQQSDKGKLLIRAVADAEKKNEQARISDDAQGKLDAANSLLDEKTALATAQSNALATDPTLQAALVENKAVKAPANTAVAKTLRDDAPDAIKILWAHRDQIRKGELKRLSDKEKELRGAAQSSKDFQLAKEYRKQADDVLNKEHEIQAAAFVLPHIRNPDFSANPHNNEPNFDDFKTGFVGEPPQFQIRQVVDARNMIVTVIRDREGFDFPETDVFLTGYDTAGLTDDTFFRYPIDSVLWITGTKQFEAANSATRTILQARFVNLDDYLK